MRSCFLLLIVFLVSSLLAGCGGQRRYQIETDGDGLLRNVRTVPDDGDYNVPKNVWIRVYWPDGTEPPAVFTFALRNGSDVRVHTYRHEGDQDHEWWFEPTTSLDYDSRYKIELESGDERITSFFFTAEAPAGSTSSLASSPANQKAGPRISGPEEEQVVRTRLR